MDMGPCLCDLCTNTAPLECCVCDYLAPTDYVCPACKADIAANEAADKAETRAAYYPMCHCEGGSGWCKECLADLGVPF